MKNSLITAAVIAFVVASSIAQYNLVWDAFTGGGTEFPNARTGGGYRLADNLGRGTTDYDTFLASGDYVMFPGYRWVELDLRHPNSWIDSLDTISHSPFFIISWGSSDTTLEDGEGWGTYCYTIEYARNSPTTWLPWLNCFTGTMAQFGPFLPETVRAETTYYFRITAFDYATNLETTHAGYDYKCVYILAPVTFEVYNLIDFTTNWINRDSVDVGAVITMEDTERFIVRNPSANDTVALEVKGNPYAIDRRTGLPVWQLRDTAGTDEFAIRAIFNDNPTAPLPGEFDATTIVRDTFIAADGPWYGPGGLLLPREGTPPDSTLFTDNLWFQLRMPTWTSQHGDTVQYQMIVRLRGRRPTP